LTGTLCLAHATRVRQRGDCFVPRNDAWKIVRLEITYGDLSSEIATLSLAMTWWRPDVICNKQLLLILIKMCIFKI